MRTLLTKLFALALSAAGTATAQAPSLTDGTTSRRTFSGVYVAMDVGLQNIIGGALVRGTDVLRQTSRPVVSVSVGARYQLPSGTVLGAAVGLGLTNGNLHLDDGAGLNVRYRNRAQWDWDASVGQALGNADRTMVFAYLSEVTRRFDVAIDDAGRRFAQRDEQGLLRFGLGVERRTASGVAVRGSLGSSRADFGGRRTNIVPRHPLDVSLGVAYGFAGAR